MKKVLKDIEVMSVDGLKNGNYDLGFVINGVELIDMDLDDGLKIMEANNLIKNGHIIIPKGSDLTEVRTLGGATEYNFNNGQIITDLCFDGDESEYIA